LFQVVEAELAELAQHGVTPATTYPEFKKGFLASRPMGFGSHSLLARGLYALQVMNFWDRYTYIHTYIHTCVGVGVLVNVRWRRGKLLA
jgi:hypothetical protein